MELEALPSRASWRHREARSGYEIAFFRDEGRGHRLAGRTTAREAGSLWSIGYDVVVDDSWRTTTVDATAFTADGVVHTALRRDARHRWTVNDTYRPELYGCLDVDFESSAMTNTLPIHRIAFQVGLWVEVPAAFVRADSLRVERLEQRYTLRDVGPDGAVFGYESSTFGFACELSYDRSGLVRDYPGIAVREAA